VEGQELKAVQTKFHYIRFVWGHYVFVSNFKGKEIADLLSRGRILE
jgi:hypothetical protein